MRARGELLRAAAALGGLMREQEGVTRYDFDGDYGYCGCGIIEVDGGDFVSYDDYVALRSQLIAIEKQRDQYHALWTKETLAKRELADRIREMEASAERAERDTERLEWLQTLEERLTSIEIEHVAGEFWISEMCDDGATCLKTWRGMTIREAFDRALDASGRGES